MSDNIVISASVDQMLEQLPIGSLDKSIGNNLYGINSRGSNSPLPMDKTHQGYTFFTRPQLNMTTFNVSNYRGFYSLLSGRETSYQRFTRMTLDPRLHDYGMRCPFVDPENVFIPILTNTLSSMSGFPDLTVPTYTSEPGLYGEEHGFVDGVTNHYESFDVDATFKSMRGNPLIYFFYIWIKYQTLVYEGILNPHVDMITEDEIDYNTRIYRIVLDESKRYVKYMGATGASFPLNVPTGSIFDFNSDKPYNDSNAEVNIRFKSFGFTPFDDILKKEFNEAGAIFNQSLRAILVHDLSSPVNETVTRHNGTSVYEVVGSSLVKIPHYLVGTMDGNVYGNPYYGSNYRAYPYINLATGELEWWVPRKILANIIERMKRFSNNDRYST